jgi:DNA modification methylase
LTARILTGDCRAILSTLDAGSVHCVVTSPPYFGLRDYGTAQWDGGDAGCDHMAPPKHVKSATTTLGFIAGYRDNLPEDNAAYVASKSQFRDTCGKCGAIRQDRQIGLESSLDAYIAELATVFREVKRVLRDDGTCWLNLGDSYAGGKMGRDDNSPADRARMDEHGHGGGVKLQAIGNNGVPRKLTDGLKPKDLMMVPARVALALQADGWWLRSDIIWAKKAPMPESVTDRPTSAHEHVFLLTKKPRYFYDAIAVAEQTLQPFGDARLTGQHKADAGGFTTNGHGPSTLGTNQGDATRNMRNVWLLGPEPFPSAHFATFVTEIPRRAILAGTSEKGCCAACGAPWVRQIERTTVPLQKTYDGAIRRDGIVPDGPRWGGDGVPSRIESETLGWQSSCSCNADIVPATILDPFGGAGTVGLVADRLGRNSILIELNEAYAKMARQRLIGDCPMFAEVTT